MQGYFSGHDNELTNGQLPDATVDQWNSMVNRVVAGLPNVRIIDPNKGWDADRMMTNFHPNDVGEDHIAQLRCSPRSVIP